MINNYYKPKENEINVTLFTVQGKVVLVSQLFPWLHPHSSSSVLPPRLFRVVFSSRARCRRSCWKVVGVCGVGCQQVDVAQPAPGPRGDRQGCPVLDLLWQGRTLFCDGSPWKGSPAAPHPINPHPITPHLQPPSLALQGPTKGPRAVAEPPQSPSPGGAGRQQLGVGAVPGAPAAPQRCQTTAPTPAPGSDQP